MYIDVTDFEDCCDEVILKDFFLWIFPVSSFREQEGTQTKSVL